MHEKYLWVKRCEQSAYNIWRIICLGAGAGDERNSRKRSTQRKKASNEPTLHCKLFIHFTKLYDKRESIKFSKY